MKGILAICDGLGGRPTDYRGKTCLEAADTPNLNNLASRGAVGLLDPIKPGVRPGSDTAHLSLFGYNPHNYYTGRGYFEALGIGMNVESKDVSFRTNFGTVDENLVVQDRRAGRIQEGQEELEKALQKLSPEDPGVEAYFKTSTEHRGALILRGPNLSGNITDIDPHETGVKTLKSKPSDGKENSHKTANILNDLVEQSHKILKDLPINKKREGEGKPPANIILPRGAALSPNIPTLNQRYGVDGTMTGGGALYIGIAKALGLKFKKAKGATGGANSKIINKAKLAVEELKSGTEFVFVHMKGADSCGHDNDPECKISYLEKVDEVIGYFLENLDWKKTHLAFTGDHSTPIVYGGHTSDPLPMVFAGPNVMPDNINKFEEKRAYQGGIGRISGQVAPILFGYCNWLKKFGA